MNPRKYINSLAMTAAKIAYKYRADDFDEQEFAENFADYLREFGPEGALRSVAAQVKRGQLQQAAYAKIAALVKKNAEKVAGEAEAESKKPKRSYKLHGEEIDVERAREILALLEQILDEVTGRIPKPVPQAAIRTASRFLAAVEEGSITLPSGVTGRGARRDDLFIALSRFVDHPDPFAGGRLAEKFRAAAKRAGGVLAKRYLQLAQALSDTESADDESGAEKKPTKRPTAKIAF